MNYELKSTNQPTVKTDGTDTIVTIGFNTGIVGCPYKMEIGNSIIVTVPNSGAMTRDAIDAYVITEVNAFIAANYPTT